MAYRSGARASFGTSPRAEGGRNVYQPIRGLSYGDSFSGQTGIGPTETTVARIMARRPAETWTAVSIGALELQAAIDGFATNVQPVLDAEPTARWLLMYWCITHGDVLDTNQTTQQIVDKLVTLVSLGRSAGCITAVTTVPGTVEFNDPGGSPYRRPAILAANDLIRNGDNIRPRWGGADILFDAEKIPGLTQLEQPSTYPSTSPLLLADGLHPSALGHDAFAQLVHTILGGM